MGTNASFDLFRVETARLNKLVESFVSRQEVEDVETLYCESEFLGKFADGGVEL